LKAFTDYFLESLQEDQINEGLIASYDISKLVKEVQSLLNCIEEHGPTASYTFNQRTKYGQTYSYAFLLQRGLTEEEQTKLSRILNVYGYFNSSTEPLRLQIEPAYPVLLNGQFSDSTFFHITQKKYIDKIRQMGLTPRISETTFDHPGNRVYLLKVLEGSPEFILKRWADILAKSKSVPETDMEILRVDLSAEFPVYLDDTTMYFSNHSKVLGAFTTKNIPPNSIH